MRSRSGTARTGTLWTDLPEHFGWWKGAHNRLRKWAADGTWAKVLTALPQAGAGGDLDWAAAADSTTVCARQPAAGALARRGPGRRARRPGPRRLRGGLTTKIHLTADGHGRPPAFVITPGRRTTHPYSSRS
ncbi:transposase [Streptomyces sp. NPDC005533]|uniref:transposase n=1 Tax=Streptomyces sp. NPDC005533 TaxID=3364723 RepID=UPI0036CBA8DA